MEIPPQFAGQSPINPIAQLELEQSGGTWTGKGAQGLAEDVRHYGSWMLHEAERRIGHLYPKAKLPNGSDATVIAWLWARTVRSPDPAAKGAMVPLVSSFMLSTKPGKKAWVEVVIDNEAQHGWRFEVRSGALSKEEETRLKAGTIGRSGGGTCVLSGASMPFTYVREEGKRHGLGVCLMAIVAESDRARVYLPPEQSHSAVASQAKPSWEPEGDLPNNPRDFKTPNYGMNTFASLFTPRQLVALTTLSDLVGEARKQVLTDSINAGLSDDSIPLHQGGGAAEAYADAVATYLAFLISRLCDYGSSLATWLTDDNAIRGTFGRQALPMTWDFCEGSPFGDSSAALKTIIKTVSSVIESNHPAGIAHIDLIDAPKNNYPVRPCVISTDPPYYDNIGYADLSDYFYIWLRSSLSTVWPNIFRRLATPKAEELVATPYRHGGKESAEAFFMDGMADALTAMRNAATDDQPLAIYYAFKQSEIVQDGISSAGWASFLQAVVNAGLVVDGTWPMRTESAGRLIGNKANALASSIVLVCRKRPTEASVITREVFIRLLKREMPDAIDDIRKAGVGPVDMQQSVIGPGMGVFSRHAKILMDDDSPMTVKMALADINRIWGEIENEGDATLDAETQVALAWFGSYGFDSKSSGDLITLANAKNIPTSQLFKSDVFDDLSGKAGLKPRDRLSPDWTPAGDASLTIWECVQHTARALGAEDGGDAAAARLIAQMGPKAADARALAYRLFQIATDKGWAAEALVYNELAAEWPRLEALAEGIGSVSPEARGKQQYDLL